MALALALIVLAVGFGVLEAVRPAVAKRWWRRGMVTDLVYWFFTPLISRTLAVVAVAIVDVPSLAPHQRSP